jgi:hypothetical protein
VNPRALSERWTPGGPRSPGKRRPRAAPATDRGKRIPGRSARTARSTAQLSTPVRSSPLPSSVGYTVATRGYSYREGQPAGPVIEGHADPIDDLLNDRVSLDTP